MKLHLNQYLDLSINVIPVVNSAREDNSSLFSVNDSQVLSMFLNVYPDIRLQVLHNGINAVGFSGTRKLKIYEYLDQDKKPAALEDVTEIHTYVISGEDYEADNYRNLLTQQLLNAPNLVIEVGDDAANFSFRNYLTHVHNLKQVGTTHTGNIVFHREH